ncbi:MAG: hypothetical protein ACLR5B_11470 [Blautia sp.]
MILTDGTADHVNTYCVVIEGRVFTVVGTLENFENQKQQLFQDPYFPDTGSVQKQAGWQTENKKAYVGIDSILGKSEYVSRLKKQLLIQAENVVPVYLSGESGTGVACSSKGCGRQGHKGQTFYYLDCTNL